MRKVAVLECHLHENLRKNILAIIFKVKYDNGLVQTLVAKLVITGDDYKMQCNDMKLAGFYEKIEQIVPKDIAPDVINAFEKSIDKWCQRCKDRETIKAIKNLLASIEL